MRERAGPMRERGERDGAHKEEGGRWADSKKWEDGRGPRGGRKMGGVQEVEVRGVGPIGVEGRG